MTRIPSSKIVISTLVLGVLGSTVNLRAGKVFAENTGRNRVLRLQGIRGLGGHFFRPNRRGAQGDRGKSDHDRSVQGRRSGQRPAVPGWLQGRKASMEAEKEHGGPFRRRRAGRLYTGFRHGEGPPKYSRKAADGDTRCSTTMLRSDKFTADPSPADCGHACHVAVKAKDHIFHPYQKR